MRSANTRRRRGPFAKGDIIAVASGALLLASVISWLSLQVARNVIADRAVAAGKAPPAEAGH